ncbi:cupin domain-containing protein [Treponema pectinovorum]
MFIKNFVQGKIVTLKEQIEVESGTIASKTLVNSDAMTMTIFAFDAGQGVSTHSAPGDAFVVCLEGKAEIELNGEKLIIHSGESLIMPANAPHAVKAVEPYKMLLTVVKK